MGTLIGHVAPGAGFLLIGLWHLFNHIKLYVLHPNSYTSPPWFVTSRIKYLELYLIMGGCTMSVAMELFIGPDRHQPLDPDGTIPSNHLHNFEHALISMTFFIYAVFALLLDKIRPSAQYGLTQLLGAVAFAQQLLLFHLHSADHMGVEGQYHLLLQLVIIVSLSTTLIGIRYPKSFLISFLRSASIAFQGIWLIVMGYMLWTPGLIPKGCFLNLEEGHQVVRCHSDEALHRAKSLVNIGFSWFLILVTIFSVSLYLGLVKVYGGNIEYRSLTKEAVMDEDSDDVESPKRMNYGESRSFLPVSKSQASSDMER